MTRQTNFKRERCSWCGWKAPSLLELPCACGKTDLACTDCLMMMALCMRDDHEIPPPDTDHLKH